MQGAAVEQGMRSVTCRSPGKAGQGSGLRQVFRFGLTTLFTGGREGLGSGSGITKVNLGYCVQYNWNRSCIKHISAQKFAECILTIKN